MNRKNLVSLEELQSLQNFPTRIRNVCILAHVDHGKTTLADSLIASNGIISKRLAGTLRYMDSREDEQQRGITMKTSSITLKYSDNEDSLINLIDSPGHVDFSSEVSTAVRLCDGAILVVDVVEGICPQTHAVLRQIWQGKITPILVFNKIDRLITELNLTPSDAYSKLFKLLEEVNCITGGLLQAELLTREDNANSAIVDDSEDIVFDADDTPEKESKMYFAPEFNNVVFASSLDGWAFSVETFANFYAQKLGFNVRALKKTLWGNYFINYKQKKIFYNAFRKGKTPLFVSLILDNIWAVYNAVKDKNKEQTTKICSKLNVKLSLKDTQYKDPRPTLISIMSQWLPVSTAILGSVCEIVPPPTKLPEDRVTSLLTTDIKSFRRWPEQTRSLKDVFLKCNSSQNEPIIVYVSKMVPFERRSLPENRRVQLSSEEMVEKREKALKKLTDVDTTVEHALESSEPSANGYQISTSGETPQFDVSGTEFIAFARIFSGTMCKGQELYVLGPKHDPSVAVSELENYVETSESTLETNLEGVHAMKVTIGNVYVLMGRELEIVDCVPAGNLLGIAGLGKHVLKSATVSSTLHCPAFTSLNESSLGIIRVAVSTQKATDLPHLIKGLKLLNQADTNVQVLLQETGEHVILTAGEVHLERCLKDLEEFAQIPIIASDPIVPYRETIIVPPKMDRVNEAIISVSPSDKFAELKDQSFSLKLSAKPLPEPIVELLHENISILKSLDKILRQEIEFCELNEEDRSNISTFSQDLSKLFADEGPFWAGKENFVWCFGPNRVGANILFNACEDNYQRPSLLQLINGGSPAEQIRDYDSSIIHGFQMATAAGPLCEEPMMGVGLFVHDWTLFPPPATSTVPAQWTGANSASSPTSEHVVSEDGRTGGSQAGSSVSCFSTVSGRLISSFKELAKKAIQLQPCRLREALYHCDVTVSSEKLGAVYAVLNRRRGQVLSENMTEDLTAYHIQAALPVEESFGFVSEIRLKTSGRAYPQLVFSHWATMHEDPFWVPTTFEEINLYGDLFDADNLALKCLTRIRKRKGLPTHAKVVEYAEKQKNLSRKK